MSEQSKIQKPVLSSKSKDRKSEMLGIPLNVLIRADSGSMTEAIDSRPAVTDRKTQIQ
jgi:hypothetical protein